MALVKKPVTHDLEQDQFATMRTPYALQLVAKQLGLRRKVKILASQDDTYEVSSSEGCIYIIHTCTVIIIYMLGTLLVTCDSCHCSFASTMQLPCRHMFAVRDARQIPMYSEVGVGNRWKMAYLKQVFGQKKSMDLDCSYEVCNSMLYGSILLSAQYHGTQYHKGRPKISPSSLYVHTGLTVLIKSSNAFSDFVSQALYYV